MNNLIYKYRINNHKELNKNILDFLDTLPDKIGNQDYNGGISKFDGHNHISAPALASEWQYRDPMNDWNGVDPDYKELPQPTTSWETLINQYPHILYKKMFLDAAKDKLHEHARLHIQPGITGLNYALNIMHMWYHQMKKSDYDNWHNHQYCQWSAVYFIEMPEQKYVTEFLDPHTQKVIQPDVTAGDMIIFPSFLLHRVPKILTNTRKSIIAWNMDICSVFSDDQINNLKQTHSENWKL